MKKYSLLIAVILAIPMLVWGSANATVNAGSGQKSGATEEVVSSPISAEENAEASTSGLEVGTIAVKDFVGKKLGVPQGTVQDIYLMETYPQLELQRHNFEADMMLALEKGICDAVIMDDVICYALARKKPHILLFEDPSLPKNFMGMAFHQGEKGKALCKQFNEFLSELRQSGELEEICNKWIKDTESATMPKFNIPTTGEPIVVGMEPCTEPIVFMRGEDIVGMDAELIYRFAEKVQRPVIIKNIDYYGILTALGAGQIDIAASGFLITAEREESVIFSDPYYTSCSIIATRKEETAAEKCKELGIVEGIVDSFRRNIIDEERYLLIWDGLKATFAIAFFSILFGTMVGMGVCYLRMSHSKFWQCVAKGYINIMRGTPILILLMLMYYVAFAGTQIEALYVAIITFSLNFGAYVSEMFRSSIMSIDRGQSEAGIAMGFSPFYSFYYIVLPQAVKRVLPVYKGEVISLIKNTSVVGYIAIADLTKMTDIIRARTFDPFFPLLMVAILYFLIAWLFTVVLDRVSSKVK